MKYYVLTKHPEEPTRSLYASRGPDGETVIQVFLDEDTATSYNVHLEALDTALSVTELENIEVISRICDIKGYSYAYVDSDSVCVPRDETTQFDLLNIRKSIHDSLS